MVEGDCFGHQGVGIEQEFVSSVYYQLEGAPDGERSVESVAEEIADL